MKKQKTNIKVVQEKVEVKPKLQSQYKLIGVVFIILCWTFISFYPSVNCGFVNWDDQEYVYQSKLIQQQSIPFKEIFTTPVSHNYHPLTMLSLAINYQMAGLNPSLYHWTNVILYWFLFLFIF